MHGLTLAEFNWSSLVAPEVLVFVVGGLIAIIAILAGAVTSVMNNRSQARLKMDMLDRGMSAEEIERIVNAGTDAAGDAEETTS